MLKYEHIIRKMDDSDKVKILSDITCLSDKKFRILGLPSVKIGDWKDYGCEFPTVEELSHSWDPDLISRVAADVINKMAQDNVTLSILPGPKERINPYRLSLGEDPALLTAYTEAYLSAAKTKGMCCAITGFSLQADEYEWLDPSPDPRVLWEQIVQPYLHIVQEHECTAMIVDYVPGTDNESPQRRLHDLARQTVFPHTKLLYRSVPAEYTVQAIREGVLCLRCSALALESALSRHRSLSKIMKKNTDIENELKEECTNGTAISPDEVDAALDSLLTFVDSIKRQVFVPDEIDSQLPLTATLASTVLLKNTNNRLPLASTSKVLLIGDLQADGPNGTRERLPDQITESLVQKGYDVIGTARGYDAAKNRSEDLMREACEAAKEADAVIVLVGWDAARESEMFWHRRLTIPANQQQLLEHLKEECDKVIAVIPGAYSADIGMEECCAAILCAPLHAKLAAEAIARVISGQYNPCGRLANTVYVNSDDQFATRRRFQRREGLKVGPFVGYRYYDRERENPGFCFGHGCSYSSFSYSQLHVTETGVRVTVSNRASKPGVETVQVYVGLPRSSVLRPAKELAAFAKVSLAPGEQKTVEIPLRFPQIYLADEKRMTREEGRYVVYVGSSLSDIHLMQSIDLQGAKLAGDQHKISDYIPSESNIIIDQFKLEAECKPMKKARFGFIAGTVAIVLAIALKLYCQMFEISQTFFNIFALVLLFFGIILYIREAVTRNDAYHRAEREQQDANEVLFEKAETIPVASAANMFVKEFDEVEESADLSRYQAEMDEDKTLSEVDKEYTLAAAAQDFAQFAQEHGYKFSPLAVANVLSAVASSRIVTVYDMTKEEFRTLMGLLSEFFGTALYLDTADDQYTEPGNVLFVDNKHGNRTRRTFMSALESARTTPKNIHLAGIAGVNASHIALCLAPYINYAKTPGGHHMIAAMNELRTTTSYLIPENVWIVLHIDEKQAIETLPSNLLEVTSLSKVRFDACQPTEKTRREWKMSHYQMGYLSERVGNLAVVDEEQWKKIDRLMEEIPAPQQFCPNNKMWLQLETFMFAQLACETEEEDALDATIAAKVLPSLMAYTKNNEQLTSERLIQLMEGTLGEEHMQACEALVKFNAQQISK